MLQRTQFSNLLPQHRRLKSTLARLAANIDLQENLRRMAQALRDQRTQKRG